MPRVRFEFAGILLDAERGRTPISQGDETRLASPCNIFARALGDVKALARVKSGTQVKVSKI
jgi:hypothetical protein